jgi:hypothetical protein
VPSPRFRRHARREDRIRCAKDTGPRNLPLKGYAQNQPWTRDITAAVTRLQAIPWNPAHPARQPGTRARPTAEN